MTEISDEEKRLLHVNQRLNYLLGYATSFLSIHVNEFTVFEKLQYDWLMQAVENTIYLDKPLTAPPKRN